MEPENHSALSLREAYSVKVAPLVALILAAYEIVRGQAVLDPEWEKYGEAWQRNWPDHTFVSAWRN
jgi:hypothetical protein